MEYTVLVILSLLSGGAAIGENKAIKVENIQPVCTAISGVDQHIETSLPGSDCVFLTDGPDTCKNCLDLNCSLRISYSGFTITLRSEVRVLPCHDGNLDVPRHAIDTRILDSNGQQIFRRLSDQSFDDDFVYRISTFFGTISVTVDVSANINNQGNGVSVQADVTASNSQYEVIPQTFLPITCIEVDVSACFDSLSSETSTPTPASTSAGNPTSTSAGNPTSTSEGTPPSTSAGTPTPTSQHAGSAGNAGAPPVVAVMWAVMLLAALSLASLCY